jgi:putative membrane protein
MTTLLTGAVAPLADCWHHGGGGWFFFPIFWILVILLVLFLVRRGPWRPGRHHRHYQSAAEVLEARFARGEIDDDEFRRRRSTLGGEDDR